MQYLLDTNICIFFLRGKMHLNKIIREKGIENCFISELTVFELKYRAENSDNPEKSHQAVNNFINGLTVIPIFGVVAHSGQTTPSRQTTTGTVVSPPMLNALIPSYYLLFGM